MINQQKVTNYRDTRKRCEDVFVVNFEYILHVLLVFLLLTLNIYLQTPTNYFLSIP